VNGYFKSGEIAGLQEELTAKDKEVLDWTGKYKALNGLIPQDGINGLLQEL